MFRFHGRKSLQRCSSEAQALAWGLLVVCLVLLTACGSAAKPSSDAASQEVQNSQASSRTSVIRVASFNMALNSDMAGGVIERLQGNDAVARQLAAIIQTVRPDVILLNEIDHDSQSRAADLFQSEYLERGEQPLYLPFRFAADVNTGIPTGIDLNGDGKKDGPEDAFGFGRHPGQYGMLVLSRFPILHEHVRTFQKLRWHSMPDALRPMLEDGTPYWPDAVWHQLRLSSKSHWDLPIATPAGVFHLLAAHPTPPVFDGAEDRNGRRNHDEIRLFADYVDPERSHWIVDDRGHVGGLAPSAPFVIVGDYNADPARGSSSFGAILQLLQHPAIQDVVPQHGGEVSDATADFGSLGRVRVDYVLPSKGWQVHASGVFWPESGEPGHAWLSASDHRLVWVDLSLP